MMQGVSCSRRIPAEGGVVWRVVFPHLWPISLFLSDPKAFSRSVLQSAGEDLREEDTTDAELVTP